MNILLLPKSAENQNSFVVEDKSQVSHIQNVLGLVADDTIKVGISSGKLGTAVISDIHSNTSQSNQIDHSNFQLSQVSSIKTDSPQVVLSQITCKKTPPPKLDLTIVLALPRPKVLRRLIMDMTAIGVQHIILVNSYRTDKSYWQSPMLNRIDEFVIEGLQQGVDTIPPVISFKKRFKPFVEDELRFLTQTKCSVVAHPYANQSLAVFEEGNGRPQIICIGAEGGWIDYEVELLQENGCHTVNLGSRILRTEAVVNALCGRYL